MLVRFFFKKYIFFQVSLNIYKLQLTFGQHKFELHGSIYTQIFFFFTINTLESFVKIFYDNLKGSQMSLEMLKNKENVYIS